MGNICRSPTAEAVFKQKVKQAGLDIHVESAGTLALHKGNKPDKRSMAVGEQAGYSFKGLQSRPVEAIDFERFNLILAMDKDNIRELLIKCPQEYKHKVQLLLTYADSAAARESNDEVPDPYYGGSKGFDLVLDLVAQGCDGLINHLSDGKR